MNLFADETRLVDPLQKGASTSHPRYLGDEGRRNPLAFAAGMGHLEVVRCLLAAGTALNDANPLCLASEAGHTDIMACLISAGADPNAEMHCGCTPLSCATVSGHVEAVKFLLQNGVKLDFSG